MKPILPVLAILSLALIAGCNKDEQNNVAIKTETETFKYRFSSNGCDTYPRMAISKDQLCRNLQIPSANNGCAIDARKSHFQKHCPDKTWNPEVTKKEMADKPGAHMNCFISEGDAFTLDDLLKGKSYINEQYTTDPVTVIPHNDFVAVVKQELKGGRFAVDIKLMTDYPNGTLIAEGHKEWQDQEPTSLQVDGNSSTARATCWPSIH